MPCPKPIFSNIFPCHQFPSLSFLKYSAFSAVSGSFLANLHLTPPLFSLSKHPLPPQLSMPCHCLLRSFQSLPYRLLPTPLITVQNPTPSKIHRSTSLLFYKLLKTHVLRKASSAAELLLPWDHCWWQQPFSHQFYCFLETGALCPEPAAVTELVAPAGQDTDAQGPGQCTPKCNNSLLFSTLPCWDSTLNSEELAHPTIQKKSLFVRVNMGHCYRKQWCYHSYARSWRCHSLTITLKTQIQFVSTTARIAPSSKYKTWTSVWCRFHHPMKEGPSWLISALTLLRRSTENFRELV